MSYGQLVQKLAASKGNSNTAFAAPGLAGSALSTQAIGASSKMSASLGQTIIDNSMNFGDINIYNATAEPASDSLPSAIRKVSAQGGRRKPSSRLEAVKA